MIDYIKVFVSSNSTQQNNSVVTIGAPIEPLEEPNIDKSYIHAKTMQTRLMVEKPSPFYVSMFIHGHRLSNCIPDSGASDNIMLATVAKAIDFPLTKTFGKFYVIDSKQVP